MAKKKVQDMVSRLGFTAQEYGKVEYCLRYILFAGELRDSVLLFSIFG